MKHPFKGEKPVPDRLRCRRTDGRNWRCPRRRRSDSIRMCDYHYAKLAAAAAKRREKTLGAADPPRNCARNTPRSRKRAPEAEVDDATASPGPALRRNPRRRRPPSRPPPESDDDEEEEVSEAKTEELIGMALRRQMERRGAMEKRRSGAATAVAAAAASGAEVTRDLPNGVMAISPAKGFVNAAPPIDCKIGFEAGGIFGRRYRSKNAEPIPVGSCQELPYRRGLSRVVKRVCHRCTESRISRMTQCSGCGKFFCASCIKKWYSELSELEVKAICPICRGNCSCKMCMQCCGTEDAGHKDCASSQIDFNKIRCDHYLICPLLPVLEQFNAEQKAELELEANNQGRRLSGVQLQVAEYNLDERLNCNCCKLPIADFHRSCSNCSYKLCLWCSQDIRERSTDKGGLNTYKCPRRGKAFKHNVDKAVGGMKLKLSSRVHPDKSMSPTSLLLTEVKIGDDSNSCPSKEFGGCGDGILNLIFTLPLGSTKKLNINGKQLVCSYNNSGSSSVPKLLLKALDSSNLLG